MYCSHCGKELIDTALMCPNCGALTKNAPIPEPPQEEKKPAEENSEAEKATAESANETEKQEEKKAEIRPEPEKEEDEDNEQPQIPFFVPGLVPPRMPESYIEDMQTAAIDYGVVPPDKKSERAKRKKQNKKAHKAHTSHKPPKQHHTTVKVKSKPEHKQWHVTRNPATLTGFIMSAIGFLFGFILISLILAERGGEAFLSISLAIVNITLIPALIGFILSMFGFCRKNTDFVDGVLFIFATIFSGLLIAYYFVALCIGIC